jgi:hypothetical protein
MSARTSAELIEDYLGRLRAEFTSVGAAETGDLLAEIRSLLIEAAGDDPERAAVQIAKFGEPAELAAGILAERGLTSEGGMATAEWWRMGIAVPIDIAIGVSVPLAASFPVWSLLQMLRSGGETVWPVLVGLVAFFLGSLWWPWYVWRPWRAGGPRATAGMTLTDLAVVRAPGFHKVVRSSELGALGLTTSRRSRISGVATLVFAVLLLAFSAFGAQVVLAPQAIAVDRLVGTEAEQRQQVADLAARMYDTLVARGGDVSGEAYVTDDALPAYRSLVRRAQSERLASYQADGPTRVSPGAWKVDVTEKTSRGTHRVTITFTLRVILQPNDTDNLIFMADWVVYDISGEGIAPGQ